MGFMKRRGRYWNVKVSCADALLPLNLVTVAEWLEHRYEIVHFVFAMWLVVDLSHRCFRRSASRSVMQSSCRKH